MGTNRNEYEIKDDIIKIFYQIKHETSNVKFGLKISRSQSIRLENALYKILTVIKDVIYDNYSGLISPFLLCTDDPDEGFFKEDLIPFIDNEIDILNDIKLFDHDYYYKSFMDRLLILIDKTQKLE